ncbi:MAG: ATP-binding protein [Elusimicrobia bacterium]|nr:ATP-binding protein [Elusimicrobiota bacterium]
MHRYVPRAMEPELLAAASGFPVVVLTGPRQTGKSTLLRKTFPKHAYATLDDPLTRRFAAQDPKGFLAGDRALIIDEVQNLPELLPEVKIAVDSDRTRKGRFLLSGSQYFPLMAGLSESLAGRAALFELLGFSTQEAAKALSKGAVKDPFTTIFRGSYPEIVAQGAPRDRFLASYVQTYLERDIRQITSVHDLRVFQAFLELLAARVGALLNLSEVAKECGVSFTTARRWLSLLEATRIVYLLRPYFKNVTKRVVKSPKVYFTDTGLLCYLLRYPNPETLSRGPQAGALLECHVVTEVLKLKLNHNLNFEPAFYQDSNRNEVDLVLDFGSSLKLIEVKATATPRAEHCAALARLGAQLKPRASFLISLSPLRSRGPNGVELLPWDQAASAV